MFGALETVHREVTSVDELAGAIDGLELELEDDVEEFEGYD